MPRFWLPIRPPWRSNREPEPRGPAGVITTFADPAGPSSTDELSDIVAGPDVIVGTGGADTVNPGKGSDAALGGNGDDQLSGGSGNDGLKGGGGNDRLVGGTNRDTCEGQTGVDIAHSCEVITGVP